MQCVDRLGVISSQALKEMRLLVYELRSPIVNSMGLSGAIQNRLDAVERRSKVVSSLEVNNPGYLPPRIEEHLYRIALEALNNSLKHAGASRVDVSINYTESTVSLQIKDDGVGFDLSTAANNGGMGLASIRERTEKLGGRLEILSAPDQGSSIKVIVPLR
jgi:signal transduction histidine kinase